MTEQERREAARLFYDYWRDKGEEKKYTQKFWLDLLQKVYGVENAIDYIDYEKTVVLSDGVSKVTEKFLDGYIADTKVLIEQKSSNIDLGAAQPGHGGKTPYQQAKEYNDFLPADDKVKWIILCNFKEIWIYNMNEKIPTPTKILLEDLQNKYNVLKFLVNDEVKELNHEMQVSMKAGEIVGKLYDALIGQYKEPDNPDVLKSLNKLCVRIVFCLYAEDADIFGQKDMFHDYLARFDAHNARKALRDLFKILNQKPEERDKYLADDDPLLAAFPYVNGGLFADDDIEIPTFTEDILNLILNNASMDFDWSQISPTIFGAVFESTLNPDTRRKGGMHYTSIENIHKVIDPLFMDELKAEYDDIIKINVKKTRKEMLGKFHEKLASLKWLDPACGSGNFLTETYISVRRLENKVIAEEWGGIPVMAFEDWSPIKVSISQFYGIEINDFAVTVAKTALWIAESQMMKETEDIVHLQLDFLPLKTNAYIVEGNALEIDWENVVGKNEIRYIMGNPPFVGQTLKTKEQSADMANIFGSGSAETKLDYVICWYKKAIRYIKGTDIKVAFVSTNSICQGESVPSFWKNMVEDGAEIQFAHKSFKWTSESSKTAAVHCVIVGFSSKSTNVKRLYEGKDVKECKHINAYLMDGEDMWLESRSAPKANMPKLQKGSEPSDGGNLFLDSKEAEELVNKYPQLSKYVKPFIGGSEFLKNKDGEFSRYCLWFAEDFDPNDIINVKEIQGRLNEIRKKRSGSSADRIRKMAEKPHLFSQIRQPQTSYIVIPETTTSSRRCIPMGFFDKDVIAGNSTLIAPNMSLYHFGILISSVHMTWMRVVCGRMGMGYRYSPSVYNNFPWVEETEENRAEIEKTAQMILDARRKYPNNSLYDMYGDNMSLFEELNNAHNKNNIAVMKAYGFTKEVNGKKVWMNEEEVVRELIRMYNNAK